ncbi:MAG: DUF711 family protein [Thermoplasmata archaeon]|nr:DUF711 family protein [Thermoplasmata archaeon]
MRIRTITLGTRVNIRGPEETISRGGEFLKIAKRAFEKMDIEVQTVRISTQPFEDHGLKRDDLLESICGLEHISKRYGIDFLSIGPATTPDAIDLIPDIIERTGITCASAWAGDYGAGIQNDNIRSAADASLRISELDGIGLKNFNFTTIANCPADIPFFPASYHTQEVPTFTIGMESGDVLYDAFKVGGTLKGAGMRFKELYEQSLKTIENSASELSQLENIFFGGIDVSTAPSLEKKGSVALAISNLLDGHFASPGTLSVCEMITGVLRSLDINICGYSGLMLPVMEDLGLAEASDNDQLTIPDLLSYSSVCGTGLDTVPIPGDTEKRALENTIRDVASLSIRLNKPLSARLLPMIGIKKGERTDVHSPYLVNCKVLPV